MTSLPMPMRVRSTVVHALIALLALAASRSAALAQTVGDFNDDGVADLAIGAPGEGINGNIDAGAVHVIYGVKAGLDSAGSQIWHLDRPNVPDECENNDNFGAALAAGDFDSNGIDDLAIGIPGKMIGSDPGAGAILVLFGSDTGLIATDAQFLHQDVAGILDGAEFNDFYGSTMASGDFDGDLFDDLAIGVPGERSTFGIAAGAVSVLYGNNNGLSSTDDQFFQQGADDIEGTPEGNDRFGSALAAGDFNNDGRDELAIGTPNEGDAAGVVHVLFGTAAGLTGTISQVWSQNTAGILDTAEDDDDFGAAIASGDFDNDGFADLAIGASGEDGNGFNNVGVVHVLYGSAGGLNATGAQFWSQDTAGVLDQVGDGDRFGYALAAGDFDGDTFDDLAIGIAGENVAGLSEAGAVAILFGGTGGGITAAGDEFWHQNIDGVLDTCEFEDRFGTTLCVGDFNNDGHVDLAVGIPFENIGGADAGAVHAFYGANSGLRAGPDQFWHQNRPGIAEGCEGGDNFGGGNAQ